MAINSALETRRSEAARLRLWDWINDRYHETRVLILANGKQIKAKLIKNDVEYVAVQNIDDSTEIIDVTNRDQIPTPESSVLLRLGEAAKFIISKQ